MEIALLARNQGDCADSARGRSGSRCRIDEAGLVLTLRADSTLSLDPAGSPRSGGEVADPIALFLPHCDGELRSAVMLLPGELGPDATVLLDGYPPLAVSELADGAEISIGADCLVYHETRRELTGIFDCEEVEDCTRCKRPLERGDSFRRCGNCLSPYHEGARANPEQPHLLCASYDPACGRCGGRFDSTPNSEDQHDGE